MEERLHARVVGQDEAVRLVSEAVRRARAGLQDPQPPDRLVPVPRARPASARPSWPARWREFLFDDERAMVRIDMSEYMEKHTVARLIGAPPGYVGYEEGGALTEAVRRRPYAVMLFDEIEKAHPDVLNVLLQLLDDGRLTDGQGRTVDFRNALVIMTSNLGSEAILELAATTSERELRWTRRVNRALRAHFRPEFLNRIDEIVIFHALDLRAQLRRIVDLQAEAPARAAGRARASALTAHRPRPRRAGRARATTRSSARGRSSATHPAAGAEPAGAEAARGRVPGRRRP